jgi:periplasmic divalent cation tolerance protein
MSSMALETSPEPGEFVVVLVTFPTREMATNLARIVVAEKLAACVNILPEMRSIYAWEGNICDEEETLCLMKTRRERFSALHDRVLSLHPYKVPEIIALPILEGSPPYLTWLRDETPETVK